MCKILGKDIVLGIISNLGKILSLLIASIYVYKNRLRGTRRFFLTINYALHIGLWKITLENHWNKMVVFRRKSFGF